MHLIPSGPGVRNLVISGSVICLYHVLREVHSHVEDLYLIDIEGLSDSIWGQDGARPGAPLFASQWKFRWFCQAPGDLLTYQYFHPELRVLQLERVSPTIAYQFIERLPLSLTRLVLREIWTDEIPKFQVVDLTSFTSEFPVLFPRATILLIQSQSRH